MKRFLNIYFILFLVFVGFFAHRLSKFPDPEVLPLPYIIAPEKNIPAEIEKAHILIMGDQLAGKLAEYTDAIIDHLSANQKTPLRLFNWARPGESLARTLQKIKSLV